jgi:2-oxoisovalerate dehydrogenase E1 component
VEHLYRAIEAAGYLEEKYGLIGRDNRCKEPGPFNYELVVESVKKTGRIILITGDANTRGHFLNDMAQKITDLAFDYLDAPPVVVGSRNWIVPAHELEDHFFRRLQLDNRCNSSAHTASEGTYGHGEQLQR